MKKPPTTTRKHGYQARAQIIARRLRLQAETEVHEAPPPLKQRLTTQLTFEQSCQSYLWTTDRGRSRLIKH